MPEADCATVSSKEKSASSLLGKTKKKGKRKQKLVLKVIKRGIVSLVFHDDI